KLRGFRLLCPGLPPTTRGPSHRQTKNNVSEKQVFFKRIMESQRLLKVYSQQGSSGIGFVGNKNDSSLVSQHLCSVYAQ
uniref:Uncharacterized protein n=1 Tax=Aquila chrysaetos chrysaetos TaxID=223781 RepID=A0A663F2N3_AQUCH